MNTIYIYIFIFIRELFKYKENFKSTHQFKSMMHIANISL